MRPIDVGILSTIVFCWCVVLGSDSLGTTADYPTSGALAGKADRDFMEYQCGLAQSGILECKFTQLSIRKSAKPKDLAEQKAKLPEIEKEFREGKGLKKSDCKTFRTMEEAIRSGKLPPSADKDKYAKFVANASPQEKQDMLDGLRSLVKVCESPNRENILRMIETQHDKKSRTCAVSANNFKAEFQSVDGKVWVQTTKPHGPCGVVTISSFEKETTSFNISFWNYKTRKVVTNKKADLVGNLMKCSDLDETEYTYGWKSETFFKGCDYVKHSVF